MQVVFIILIGILFASLGQILWKIGMNDIGAINHLCYHTMLMVISNVYVIIGVSCYGISTIFWLIALSRADLSFVYPFIALTFVIIFISSAFLFHESISITRLLGALIIVIGILVLVRG